MFHIPHISHKLYSNFQWNTNQHKYETPSRYLNADMTIWVTVGIL